jgi:hypothetical protein
MEIPIASIREYRFRGRILHWRMINLYRNCSKDYKSAIMFGCCLLGNGVRLIRAQNDFELTPK